MGHCIESLKILNGCGHIGLDLPSVQPGAQSFGVFYGRGDVTVIEVGRKGDQALARQALAQVFEESIQSPPRVENQDACSCTTFGQSEIAIGLDLCHVYFTIRENGRAARPSLALIERADKS